MNIAKPLEEMLEKEWDFMLFGSKKGLAPMLGWRLCYHTLRSKGSQSGFPDRVLVRERVIFVELKRELTGKASEDAKRQPTEHQREWLDGLALAGAEVYLWRPSDLEEAGRILSMRVRPIAGQFGTAWWPRGKTITVAQVLDPKLEMGHCEGPRQGGDHDRNEG